MKAKIVTRSDAKPVFRPKRPVSYAVVDKLDEEIERLQKLGVISPVNYSAWAAPVVAVKKPNSSLRLCVDFSTGLNKALEARQYPLPHPDDLFAKLNGGKLFSKIDLSEAYLQIEVEPECRELLTINMHRGLYQYNRPPSGVKCAPAIFQQTMDTMLADLPFATAYLDDIIIVSQNEGDHGAHLGRVLNKISEYGFRVEPEMCSFLCQASSTLVL